MKIVMLMSVYGERAIGGAERTAGQMAKQLVLRGHEVHLMSLSPMGRPEPTLRLEEGVTCHQIALSQWYDPYHHQAHNVPDWLPASLGRLWASSRKMLWHLRDIYNFKMVAAVRKRLAELQPDILFTHTLQGFSVGVWNVAQSLGIKVVHMTHDHALICPGTAMTKGTDACERVCTSCQIFSRTRRLVCSEPNAITGPSDIVLERHKRFGWFQNIALQRAIPNSLPRGWPNLTESEFKVPPTISSTSNPIIFGFLGRVDESKGADTLIKAVTLLPPHLKGQWRLLIGGQGSISQIEEWATKEADGANLWSSIHSSIEYLGLVKADEFMRKLHVLVTPSRAHETFCNVVMEAASLGCPAIVSDRGALPERVTGGKSGWIFPAGNAHALAKQMQLLIEKPIGIADKALAAYQTRSMYEISLQTDRLEQLLLDALNA